MIYRFTLISDEADDFIREIQIDPEATFYDFHEAILKSVGYANDQMTSFFICSSRIARSIFTFLSSITFSMASLVSLTI